MREFEGTGLGSRNLMQTVEPVLLDSIGLYQGHGEPKSRPSRVNTILERGAEGRAEQGGRPAGGFVEKNV